MTAEVSAAESLPDQQRAAAALPRTSTGKVRRLDLPGVVGLLDE